MAAKRMKREREWRKKATKIKKAKKKSSHFVITTMWRLPLAAHGLSYFVNATGPLLGVPAHVRVRAFYML